VLVLSGPGTFGAIADVKTPPEEVPLWEMPELLCVRPLLGSSPLGEDEIFLVRGVRRMSCCTTEGPLLGLAGEAPAPTPLDIAAVDISRHVDDRRFAVETLRRDGSKWGAAMRQLGKATVAVAHPPLLGVDRHWAFAMQLLAACSAAVGDTVVELAYSLDSEGYMTGSPPAEALSPSQTKEFKHFEALSGRMRSAGWTVKEALELLALFPFGRVSDGEKFHAFWTRRLRDRSAAGGRASGEELASLAERQAELWPPTPAPAPPPSPSAEPPAEGHTVDVGQAPTKAMPVRSADRPAPPPPPPPRRDRSRSRRRSHATAGRHRRSRSCRHSSQIAFDRSRASGTGGSGRHRHHSRSRSRRRRRSQVG